MWYKKYGWDSNPFSVKPTYLVVGLEKQRKRLKDFTTSENACLLIGPTGSGKTSLLFWLKNELGKAYTPIYINCVKAGYQTEILTELKRQRRFVDKLLLRAYPKNIILALDEAHALPLEVGEYIKVLWDEGVISSVVLASTTKELNNFTDSFKDRIGGRYIELTKLTKSEAIDLVKLRTNSASPFDGDALERIVDVSDYNPRKILETCEKVCKSCAEKGAKKINKADVEELVSQPLIEVTKLVTPSLGKTTPPEELTRISHLDLVSRKTKLVKPMTKSTDLIKEPAAPTTPIMMEGFSPLQTKIIHLLEMESKTMAEISALTSSSIGTIGKQLSILRSRNIIYSIENIRPKKYALRKEALSEEGLSEERVEELLFTALRNISARDGRSAISETELVNTLSKRTSVEPEKLIDILGKMRTQGKVVRTGDKIFLVEL